MPTPPVRSTLVVKQGATWQSRWRIIDSDTGEPRDISTWSARGQIRADHSAAIPYYTWEDSAITCDSDGYVTVTVTAAESTGWTWRDGVFDIELIDPTGRIARIAEGAVRVSAEVTR